MIQLDSAVWPDGTISRAWFDETRKYRYMLERDFRPPGLFTEIVSVSKTVTVVALNPSVADAMREDATLRRLRSFITRWGYQRLLVVNLFAIRGTDPVILKQDPEPTGPENDAFILRACRESLLTIAAWGAHPAAKERGANVACMLRDAGRLLRCLGTTKNGSPKHPLYQPSDAVPVRFE